MSNRLLALLLAMTLVLLMTVGCASDPAASDVSGDTSAASTSAEESRDDTEDSTAGDPEFSENDPLFTNPVDVSAGSSEAEQSKPQQSQSTTKVTAKPAAIRWGVTNTKKMPNFLSNLKNNALEVVTSDTDINDAADRAAFKALTGINIKINYEVVAWSSVPERVAARVLGGNSPDLFWYNTSHWLNLVKQPYWSDWNDYIDFSDALWKETASVNNGFGDYDGKRVGLFMESYGYNASLIYNTKLVNEAIEGNSDLYDPLKMFYDDKWTWDTLYTFVEEITDLDKGIYGISLPNFSVSQFISGTGEDIIKIGPNKKLTYNLESANVIRALNFAKKFYQISDMPATWEGPTRLLNNTAGFWNNSSGVAELYVSDNMIKAVKEGKIKAVPFPRDPQSKTYYTTGMSIAYLMPQGAENPWLSAAWMYYQQYKTYNKVASLEKATKQRFMEEYGWPEDIYALSRVKDAEYASKFKKVTLTVKSDCLAAAERMTDFDQATYWKLIVDPSVLTSTVIAEIGPGLKEVISRYNAS